jgi:hypothetical protein
VPQLSRELHGLHVLAVQGRTSTRDVTSKRRVRRLADLKGLRIRAPTELLAVLRELGADPVNMPMGEVYSAMARGVIDGVIAPVDTFHALHFDEVGALLCDPVGSARRLSVPRDGRCRLAAAEPGPAGPAGAVARRVGGSTAGRDREKREDRRGGRRKGRG